MPSLKLSNPFRRAADRPSLKQRAASLKATAARVMRRKPADPFEGTTCPDGFVPYPFDKPMSFMNIRGVIHAEGVRLLDLAQAEYARRCAFITDDVPEDERHARRQAHRASLHLDILEALAKAQEAAPAAVQGSAPTSLGLACDWAIGHVEWINETSKAEIWDDDRLDSEAGKSDAVWARATVEPSITLGDLAAKARMLLADLEGEALDFDVELDDRDRLTFAVLREVSSLVPASPTGEEDRTAPASIPQSDEPATLESAATLSFDAYEFDDPILSPTEWGNRIQEQIWGLLLMDRLLRMGKAEMIAFISDAGQKNDATPEGMYRALDGAQVTLEGWGKALDLARTRYMVAASSAVLEAGGKAGA
ncbi:hypothetical protein MKK58_04440 [Methylobacterium sp. J-078]|uniref:hypothetical protein n=1 Tax=Methylobacterium sp. J-078 TaxID=2836657 RepID=UPI001FB92D2D|nr:hypothetical protein [Methylobacterium sp. J-078]MCJ2043786.1 hypothetical protein [Methylobacterium sp. J-078]